MIFSGKNKGRSFRERNVRPLGYIGTALLLAILLAAVNFQSLPVLNSAKSYSAQFTELGGLNEGDDVVVAGLIVGEVDSIDLHLGAQRYVKIGFSISDDDVRLGSTTRASVGTVTVLGRKALEVTPDGAGEMAEGTSIPLSRTTPPYDITDALNGVTGKVTRIDTTALAKSLNTVSDTFGGTPQQLTSALTGLSRISNTIASRNTALQSVLLHANSVTGVLAARNKDIALLLQNGTTLFRELSLQRQVLIKLFDNVSLVTKQINGLIGEQQQRLRPALRQLNQVLGFLNTNRKKVETVLEGLAGYAGTLGDSVGSGPFFDAYVQNLTEVASLPIFPGIGGLPDLGKLLGVDLSKILGGGR